MHGRRGGRRGRAPDRPQEGDPRSEGQRGHSHHDDRRGHTDVVGQSTRGQDPGSLGRHQRTLREGERGGAGSARQSPPEHPAQGNGEPGQGPQREQRQHTGQQRRRSEQERAADGEDAEDDHTAQPHEPVVVTVRGQGEHADQGSGRHQRREESRRTGAAAGVRVRVDHDQALDRHHRGVGQDEQPDGERQHAVPPVDGRGGHQVGPRAAAAGRRPALDTVGAHGAIGVHGPGANTHAGDQRCGQGERDGVGGQRPRGAHPRDEPTPRGVPDQQARLVGRVEQHECGGVARRTGQLGQAGRSGGLEGWRHRGGDEHQREQRQQGHRHPGHDEEDDHPHQVRGHHHRPVREPVGQRRQHLAEAEPRCQRDGRHRGRGGRGPGAIQDDVRQGQTRSPVPDLARDLRQPQQAHVAVGEGVMQVVPPSPCPPRSCAHRHLRDVPPR